MRANPRTRIRPAAHTRAHIHIYTHVCTCTHVYAHAKEIFWHQICSTASPNRGQSSVRHHSLLLSNRCTIHINIGTTLAASSVQTVNICHSSVIYYHPLATITQLSTIYLSSLTYLPFIITASHHLTRIIFYFYLMSSPTHHHINMSVQYIIKPCQFSIYLPHFPSAFSYTTDFCSINLHYNHFYYGNRIPSQSSAILIMHNYSFIDFRNEIRLKPFCIIIHPNCINIHLFDFHYGNHLLIIGFYYGICLWDFISHQPVYNKRVYIWAKNNGTV